MVWCPNSKLDLFHIWVDFGKGDHTHWSGTYCTCIIFRIEILISTLLFFCIMVLWLIYLIAKLPYVLFALWYFCLIADYLCVFCLNVWLMAFFILPSCSFLFFWLFLPYERPFDLFATWYFCRYCMHASEIWSALIVRIWPFTCIMMCSIQYRYIVYL